MSVTAAHAVVSIHGEGYSWFAGDPVIQGQKRLSKADVAAFEAFVANLIKTGQYDREVLGNRPEVKIFIYNARAAVNGLGIYDPEQLMEDMRSPCMKMPWRKARERGYLIESFPGGWRKDAVKLPDGDLVRGGSNEYEPLRVRMAWLLGKFWVPRYIKAVPGKTHHGGTAYDARMDIYLP